MKSENKLNILGIVATCLLIFNFLVLAQTWLNLVLTLIVLAVFTYQSKLNKLNYKESISVQRKTLDKFDKLNQCFNKINALLALQMVTIENEIDRANALINDGVLNLADCFKGLHELSQRQQSLVDQIIQDRFLSKEANESVIDTFIADINLFDNEPSNESSETIRLENKEQSLELKETMNNLVNFINQSSENINQMTHQLAAITPEVSEQVDQAIRSLQVEDLTNQSLTSIKTNISIMLEFNKSINDLAITQHNFVEHIDNIESRCEHLIERSKENNANRSVSQVSMSEGEIELF